MPYTLTGKRSRIVSSDQRGRDPAAIAQLSRAGLAASKINSTAVKSARATERHAETKIDKESTREGREHAAVPELELGQPARQLEAGGKIMAALQQCGCRGSTSRPATGGAAGRTEGNQRVVLERWAGTGEGGRGWGFRCALPRPAGEERGSAPAAWAQAQRRVEARRGAPARWAAASGGAAAAGAAGELAAEAAAASGVGTAPRSSGATCRGTPPPASAQTPVRAPAASPAPATAAAAAAAAVARPRKLRGRSRRRSMADSCGREPRQPTVPSRPACEELEGSSREMREGDADEERGREREEEQERGRERERERMGENGRQ